MSVSAYPPSPPPSMPLCIERRGGRAAVPAVAVLIVSPSPAPPQCSFFLVLVHLERRR